MGKVQVSFNNENYLAEYNSQTGLYELELKAPLKGGMHETNIVYSNIFEDKIELLKKIQVLVKENIKISMNKNFMWIFDGYDFSVKDIVELSDYEINIDDETNANTVLKVLKRTKAKANDIVSIKQNNEVVYWGIINSVENEDGKLSYTYTIKYLTNVFAEKIELKNEELIRTAGIEDFNAKMIMDNFINSEDAFLNKKFIQIEVLTHTKLEKKVDNVENGLFYLNTWLANCTQNYNIVYRFSIANNKLKISIGREETTKELIDIYAQNISNYTEVFENDIVAKVEAITEEGKYILYLKSDRTTTENMLDINRATGKTERIYCATLAEAKQQALDTLKQNTYKHMINFSLYNKYIVAGTPVAIKTRNSVILDTYISAIKITSKDCIDYTCGNIRTKFIDKLLKERSKR